MDAQFYKGFTHVLCSQILLISPRTLPVLPLRGTGRRGDPLNPSTLITWGNKIRTKAGDELPHTHQCDIISNIMIQRW